MSLISIALVLFFIMDPIGNVSSFMTMMRNQSAQRRSYLVLREMVFALILMLLFNFLGEYLQQVLELSDTSVHMATGLILFLAALGILFPGPRSVRKEFADEEEPFLVPLAIPLISGPALLATIMLYSQQEESVAVMLAAIFIAWTCAVAVLLLGPLLKRWVGQNGLVAAERLCAMVLVMLAIQRFSEGVKLFIAQMP